MALRGNDVIVIGSFDGGRSRPEFERMAGCCLNSLVLRTELSGNPSFVELLRRVKETALQANTHKDLPFGVLAKKLKYPRDIGRHPLFRAALVLEPSFEEDESAWNVSHSSKYRQGTPSLSWLLSLKNVRRALLAALNMTHLFLTGRP